MNRLVRTGFRRAFSMKLFWILLIGSNLSYGLYAASEANAFDLELYLFMASVPAYFSATIIAAYMVREEFLSGMIRNKLIAGHERRDVYLSWVVVSCGLSVILLMTLYVTTLLVSLTKERTPSGDGSYLLYGILLSLLCLSANAVMNTFLSAAAGKKNKAMIWPIALNFLIYISLYIMMYIYFVIGNGELNWYDHFYINFVAGILYATPMGECFRLSFGQTYAEEGRGSSAWEGIRHLFQLDSLTGFILLIGFITVLILLGIRIFKKRDIE